MGVIAIIYESRPNVTSDAAALAIKAGSACILRCGRDAWSQLPRHRGGPARRSAQGAPAGVRGEPHRGHLPRQRQRVDDRGRAGRSADPRGGARLIRACVENATVPCIQTGTGICHVYVDKAADLEMAVDIVENAKTSRPSVCNAEEALLVHRDVAAQFCRC